VRGFPGGDRPTRAPDPTEAARERLYGAERDLAKAERRKAAHLRAVELVRNMSDEDRDATFVVLDGVLNAD
jgi:hypothetical protein